MKKVSEVIDAVISKRFRSWSSEAGGHESYAHEILTALSEAGYVVVPREPTWQMRDAGMFGCEGDTSVEASETCKEVYRAMLTAAQEGE